MTARWGSLWLDELDELDSLNSSAEEELSDCGSGWLGATGGGGLLGATGLFLGLASLIRSSSRSREVTLLAARPFPFSATLGEAFFDCRGLPIPVERKVRYDV